MDWARVAGDESPGVGGTWRCWRMKRTYSDQTTGHVTGGCRTRLKSSSIWRHIPAIFTSFAWENLSSSHTQYPMSSCVANSTRVNTHLYYGCFWFPLVDKLFFVCGYNWCSYTKPISPSTGQSWVTFPSLPCRRHNHELSSSQWNLQKMKSPTSSPGFLSSVGDCPCLFSYTRSVG